MENNQHSTAKNAAANESSSGRFSNNQPGQQLPAKRNAEALDATTAGEPEKHSETSHPQKENETLGTP